MIPPEQLLSALLLQVLYGIRSERLLMEQLDYDLLFRWFVGRLTIVAAGSSIEYAHRLGNVPHR